MVLCLNQQLLDLVMSQMDELAITFATELGADNFYEGCAEECQSYKEVEDVLGVINIIAKYNFPTGHYYSTEWFLDYATELKNKFQEFKNFTTELKEKYKDICKE